MYKPADSFSAQELKKLVHFILVENHLASWDPAKARVEVEKRRTRQAGDTGEPDIPNSVPFELRLKLRVNGELKEQKKKNAALEAQHATLKDGARLQGRSGTQVPDPTTSPTTR